MEIGEAIARAGIRKRYYLETRGDVLLRNKEVFRLWQRLGLKTMFLGLEAIDEEGLRKYRKRVSLGRNFEAVEFARSLGVNVAINLIADPDWDHERFRVVREWCLEMPDVYQYQRQHPYPGTESWVTDRPPAGDPRLPPVRHPARGFADTPAARRVLSRAGVDAAAIYRRHLDWRQLWDASGVSSRLVLRGQTNFVRACSASTASIARKLLLTDIAAPSSTSASAARASQRHRQGGAPLYVTPRGGAKAGHRYSHRALCRGVTDRNRALSGLLFAGRSSAGAAPAQLCEIALTTPMRCYVHPHQHHSLARHLGIPDPAALIGVLVSVRVDDDILAHDWRTALATGEASRTRRRQRFPLQIEKRRLSRPVPSRPDHQRA